jgi:hypothetical protein
MLEKHHHAEIGKQVVYHIKFSSLEWSVYKMGPLYKHHVWKLIKKAKKVDFAPLKPKALGELAFSLGGHYDQRFGSDMVGFLAKCIRVYACIDRFKALSPPDASTAVPSDTKGGMSCFNQHCRKKHSILLYKYRLTLGIVKTLVRTFSVLSLGINLHYID